MTLLASHAFAQTTTVETSRATPTGHEVSAGFASYTYPEPGAQAISIHGAKFLGEYTTGTTGYRTDDYLYLPVGMTARRDVALHGALNVNVEMDWLMRGLCALVSHLFAGEFRNRDVHGQQCGAAREQLGASNPSTRPTSLA